MKALLDEHLSPQIAVLLRGSGYDVLAVADRDDLVACSDRVVFEAATAVLTGIQDEHDGGTGGGDVGV